VQTFLKTDPGLDAADIQVQAFPLAFDLSDRSEAMTLVVSLCRPAARGAEMRSDAAWLGFIRGTAGLNWHPAGTCGMGDVVGADLLVRGVAGVSVADASVMPWVTSGNTQAPVLAIAEKASDVVVGRTG
jgi:choline dehydrogenase-like flavoprotein